MAGDQVNLQVFNYYEGYDSAADRPLSPGALLQSIVTTLTGGAGGLDDGESHDPDIVPKLFSVANYSRFDNIVEGITDSSRPRAYLNYVLFDRRMKLVGEGSGSFQVNGDGQWGVIGTNGTAIAIPENGYFGVFIVNGSKKDVWFDQLVVEVRRGQLKEENHYYPHGLPMGHIGSVAAGETENRRKYQSNEYITDAGLNWMDFNFRQYDPQLGRFNSVDPLAGSTDMVSPYAAMGNAPESLTDPTGLRAGPALKFTMRGAGYGLMDNNIDKGYAMMVQVVAYMALSGLDIPDQLLASVGGHSGGGGGGGGGFMSMQDAVMQIQAYIAGWSIIWGKLAHAQDGDRFDGQGRYMGNFKPNIEGGGGNYHADQGTGNSGKIEALDFPANGLFFDGFFAYDLNAFDRFYREFSKKFSADRIVGDGESISVENMTNITLNGKPVKLFSEVESYLSFVPMPFNMGFMLTVSPNTDMSRKGTSNAFNMVYSQDAFIPANTVWAATIHLHPSFGKLEFKYHGIFQRVIPIPQGPTYPNDYNSVLPFRNVVVDPLYIYLINSNPAQNIIFKRP